MKYYFFIILWLWSMQSTMTIANQTLPYTGKKILYINSYHPSHYQSSYAWNPSIRQGIESVLKGTGVELKTIYMDTKRNPGQAFAQQAALDAKAVIEHYQPDVVIASDDNAAKYLIQPYYRNALLPFVFCGVNWSAEAYGFPYQNVTGMLEVMLVSGTIKQLRKYAKGEKIGFLAEDRASQHKNLKYHQELLGIQYEKIYFVKSFTQWQEKYLQLQQEVDMVMLLSMLGIDDWQPEAAQTFVQQHTKVPSGTNVVSLTPYALLGIVMISGEQGRWAAKTALKILDGTSPKMIPLVQNREGKLFINMRLGRSLKIPFSLNLLKTAEIIW